VPQAKPSPSPKWAKTILPAPLPEAEPITQSEPAPVIPDTPPSHKLFDELLKKIYDRNYELGECFKRNIEFESFENGTLTWGSSAEGEDKKQLITHWGLIGMFVKDVFGYETKIVNVPKKKTIKGTAPKEEIAAEKTAQPAVHNDADAASMIEDIEMKSSCIAPEAGDTEAAKEKDPSTLLDEPMIKEAIALLDPKKVRIKKNV